VTAVAALQARHAVRRCGCCCSTRCSSSLRRGSNCMLPACCSGVAAGTAQGNTAATRHLAHRSVTNHRCSWCGAFEEAAAWCLAMWSRFLSFLMLNDCASVGNAASQAHLSRVSLLHGSSEITPITQRVFVARSVLQTCITHYRIICAPQQSPGARLPPVPHVVSGKTMQAFGEQS
jgi:hypothetical protein